MCVVCIIGYLVGASTPTKSNRESYRIATECLVCRSGVTQVVMVLLIERIALLSFSFFNCKQSGVLA